MARRALGVVAGALLLTAGCVGSSRTDADYTSKALNTVEVVRSSLGTLQLAIDVIEHGGDHGPYLSRLIGDIEKDANAAVASFEVVQPPSNRADRVRADLADAVDPGIDALADARIAIRRSDRGAVVDLLDEVERAIDLLDRYEAAQP
jgi:hypothetical protein